MSQHPSVGKDTFYGVWKQSVYATNFCMNFCLVDIGDGSNRKMENLTALLTPSAAAAAEPINLMTHKSRQVATNPKGAEKLIGAGKKRPVTVGWPL